MLLGKFLLEFEPELILKPLLDILVEPFLHLVTVPLVVLGNDDKFVDR